MHTAEVEARFWTKIDVGDCWHWTASRTTWGYGQFRVPTLGRMDLAHRVAWQILVGPIPTGTELDHRCKNRACVNPDHLEPVTRLVNQQRGAAGAVNRARMLAATHCKHGHELTPGNLLKPPKSHPHYRRCRECNNTRQRAARQEVA